MKNLILKWLGLTNLVQREDLTTFNRSLQHIVERVWDLEHIRSKETLAIRDEVRKVVNSEVFLDEIVKRIKDKQL